MIRCTFVDAVIKTLQARRLAMVFLKIVVGDLRLALGQRIPQKIMVDRCLVKEAADFLWGAIA
jgi:hypothetical protein